MVKCYNMCEVDMKNKKKFKLDVDAIITIFTVASIAFLLASISICAVIKA